MFARSTLLLVATLALTAALQFSAHPAAAAEDALVVEWIKSNAIPLTTVEAGNGFDDMQPIKQLVGDARIVSLGESTHGTREIFQMKHRMLEFLVREMGFTVFGIEASMPDCAGINAYVLHGQGDPERAVAGQGFWTWSTEEVLDMVKWMRAYNTDPANKDKPKLKFYGFDMQHVPSAVNATMVYLQKVDPKSAKDFEPRVVSVFADRPAGGVISAEQSAQIREAMQELGQHFDEHREQYIAKSSADDFAMARRDVVVALQGLEMHDDMREQSSSLGRMAEMQLFMSVPGDAKDLLAYLEKNEPKLAVESRDLLTNVENVQQVFQKYNQSSDETRQVWEQQAQAIQAALANADNDAADKARRQADNVAKLLMVLREYRAKPDRDSVENVRDRCMAENVAWILEHEGADAKIVLWAHNGHVMISNPTPGRGVMSQGDYLEQQFGDDHVIIGFAFNQGSFQAIPAQRLREFGLREWTVGPAKTGSIDAVFASAGIPLFILDVRNAPEGAVTDWLDSPRPMRMVGAVFDPGAESTGYYRPLKLSESFDAIIFVSDTTRARPLKTSPHSSMDPMSVAMAQRPKLGVQLRQPEDGKGLLIDGVRPGQSAEAAGLRTGDRLLKIGDVEITSLPQIRQLTAKHEAGDTIAVTIERDGQEQVIQVKLLDEKSRD